MIFLFVYLGLVLLAFIFQRSLLYHPGKTPLATQREWASVAGYEEWRKAAGEMIGWKQTSSSHFPHSRLLIVHGNAGSAISRVHYADRIKNFGAWDIYILEYPGYGARGGRPSQQSFFAAADEALELLKKDGPVFIMGESIGTGVAAYLAGTHSEMVSGLVLFAPYYRLVPVAQYAMPFLPVGLLLLDRFPSEDYLKKYHGPVAMLFAGKDRVVPMRFGRKLFDSYQGPKKFWETPDAGHNDLIEQPPDWWKGLLEFWNSK